MALVVSLLCEGRAGGGIRGISGDVKPEERLVPLRTKGNTSVARVTDDWYVACLAEELGEKPRRATILGEPLVLFRTEAGKAGALLDRCPHRNVPLSLGRVRGERLECAYHGWQFDTGGVCQHVPGLASNGASTDRRVESFPCHEQDGLVWVYMTPDVEPEREPFRMPHVDSPGYTTVIERVSAQASLHATAENALDVPHTAFLHGGLFRTDDKERNPIDVVVRRYHDRVEAEYIGEQRPTGLVGKILAPKGGVVKHFDRFIMPCVVQVEYGLGESHFVVSAALTPVSDFQTELYAVISFKLPLPGVVVVPFLKPIALRIFGQDAEVLERQTETIRRFGGEQYMSTEIDVVGNHILRLLRDAERGARKADGEPVEKRLTMLV
jgi:phenylpropionate dioxygenase-like ring-hydroxylating dioxygenase large terminal subunit